MSSPDIASPPALVGEKVRLELLAYNVFVRPEPVSFGDETTCRSQRIGEWLATKSGGDVVVLTESFLEDDVARLSQRAQQRFPFQALSLPEAQTIAGVSGGVSILSRWPIEQTTARAYEECSGTFSDCLATKGFVHAVIKIADDLRINVIATHLDAGRGDSDKAARASQLAELASYVRDEVDVSMPTFFMGDFNVNGFPGEVAEYPGLLGALKQAAGREPIDAVRSLVKDWSDEPAYADASVGALNSMNCNTTIRCRKDSPDFAEAGSRRRRLDYVFVADDIARTRVIEAEHLAMEDDACGTQWLSDHKAVRAAVEIKRAEGLARAEPPGPAKGELVASETDEGLLVGPPLPTTFAATDDEAQ